jgi:undecaprenyl pyrophosphate synthase
MREISIKWNRSARVILALAMMFAAGLAQAADKRALTSEVMRVSGLEQQLAQTTRSINDSLRKAEESGKATPEQREIGAVMLEAFGTESILATVGKQLADQLSEGELQKVLSWYEGNPGQKLIRLENQLADPEKAKDLVEFAKQAEQNPIPEARQTLYKKIDKATLTTQTTVDMQLNSRVAMVKAMNKTAKSEKKLTDAEINEKIESQRPKAMEFMQQINLIKFGYLFKDVSDSDVEAYLKFAESDVGKKYFKARSRALDMAMQEGSRKVGEAMGSRIKE